MARLHSRRMFVLGEESSGGGGSMEGEGEGGRDGSLGREAEERFLGPIFLEGIGRAV